MSWLQAAAACHADKALRSVLLNNAQQRITKLRQAVEWQDGGPDEKPDLLVAICKTLLKEPQKEYPHMRLLHIWSSIQQAKGEDKKVASDAFNDHLWCNGRDDQGKGLRGGLRDHELVKNHKRGTQEYTAFVAEKTKEWLQLALSELFEFQCIQTLGPFVKDPCRKTINVNNIDTSIYLMVSQLVNKRMN